MEAIGQLLKDALLYFWDWLILWIKTLVDALLCPIADAIPDLTLTLDSLQHGLDVINYFIALDVLIECLEAGLGYIALMISVKLIVKLFIPTVG